MNTLKLEPCIAPSWAKSGHAQTLWGHFLPSPSLKEKRERLEVVLEDGDRLIGTFIPGTSRTTVSVFHGLTGSIDSGYMQRTALLARSLGHSVLLMNHRGCGEGRGFAKKPYHSGRAEDVSATLEKARELRPHDRHVAVGFSLGANALLLLLTGKRGTHLPDAALAVNAPIHLEQAALTLKKGLNRVYDLQFVMGCRRDLPFRHREEKRFEKVDFSPIGTLHDFDNWYTAPESGFKNREDYYLQCSTYLDLHKIKTPTVILTAADDPFVSVEAYRRAELSSALQLHIEQVGGHMGYVTRKPTPLGTNRWLDYAVYESLKTLD